jgi:ribosomal protein S18 acetylase RimI-like enzyme
LWYAKIKIENERRRGKVIRIARTEDLDQIMLIVKETIEDLNNEGNIQWSEEYPNRDHFSEDIKNNQLYIFEKEGKVAGFICLNTNEDEAYQGLPWRKNEMAMVIHRFAVSREKQRQSIGTKLIEYAERFALNKNICYLKVDTNSKNSRMNRLFDKMGFEFIGQINLRDVKSKFNCYDKIIENEVKE